MVKFSSIFYNLASRSDRFTTSSDFKSFADNIALTSDKIIFTTVGITSNKCCVHKEYSSPWQELMF